MYYDCANCDRRDGCPRFVPGTFCLEWRNPEYDRKRTASDPQRKDPNPEGWEPEYD